jgi:hypothetical protein
MYRLVEGRTGRASLHFDGDFVAKMADAGGHAKARLPMV